MVQVADLTHTPRVKVVVTEKIINTAVTGNSSHCMIADALRVAYPQATRVSVDIQTIRFTDPVRRQRFVYLTPRNAQLAILAFDEGRKPNAFQLTLRGGQAVAMGNKAKDERAPRSPAQRAAAEANMARARDVLHGPGKGTRAKDAPAAPTFVAPKRVKSAGVAVRPDDTSRPAVTGGKTPPKTTVGQRRIFGLRAIGRHVGQE